jgi:hypothetical protein
MQNVSDFLKISTLNESSTAQQKTLYNPLVSGKSQCHHDHHTQFEAFDNLNTKA